MKKSSLWTMISILGLSFILISCQPQTDTPNDTSIVWEYATASIADSFTDPMPPPFCLLEKTPKFDSCTEIDGATRLLTVMNNFGADGYELISLQKFENSNYVFLVFKRVKPTQ
jgi:hypothetical protein